MPSAANSNRVIVAEDMGAWRDLLRSMLTGHGFQVLLADDGVAAVDYAKNTLVSLVLMDVRMPHMDGLEACSCIRSLPGYADVPIVMLSAYDNERVRDTAMRAGASQYLTKPISTQTLMERILPLLGVRTPERAASIEWTRPPTPAYSENEELAQGRRLLEIYRLCGSQRKRSHKSDWLRRG
jgi:two-component system, sensor histidine kinase and response regulator